MGEKGQERVGFGSHKPLGSALLPPPNQTLNMYTLPHPPPHFPVHGCSLPLASGIAWALPARDDDVQKHYLELIISFVFQGGGLCIHVWGIFLRSCTYAAHMLYIRDY